MSMVVIDVTDDESGDVHVDNPRGFVIRACFDGVEIEMSHEQAENLFNGLRPWFVAEDETP